MGIIRDFTKNKIDELNEIVDYYESDGQCELFDWIGDLLASNLNVSDYLNEMEKYHKSVIDKHNIYKSDFQKIIDEVESVDVEFSERLKNCRGLKESVGSKLKSLGMAIDTSIAVIPSADFKNLISKPEINNAMLNVYGLSRGEYDQLILVMAEQYGFTEAEVLLLMKVQRLHSVYYQKEKVLQQWEASNDPNARPKIGEFLTGSEMHFFARYLASLCTNYGGGKRWGLVGGIVSVDKAKDYFEKIGLSNEQVEQLYSTINKQHVDATTTETKDFAHEMVALSIFTYKGMSKDAIDLSTFGQIDLLSSVKGDIYSGRFGKDDMLSDTDIINIFNRAKKNEDAYWGIFIDYNIGVNNGEINRGQEFLETYGDGDISKGIEKLTKDIESWSVGTDYIQGFYMDNTQKDKAEEIVQENLKAYIDFLLEEIGGD